MVPCPASLADVARSPVAVVVRLAAVAEVPRQLADAAVRVRRVVAEAAVASRLSALLRMAMRSAPIHPRSTLTRAAGLLPATRLQ